MYLVYGIFFSTTALFIQVNFLWIKFKFIPSERRVDLNSVQPAASLPPHQPPPPNLHTHRNPWLGQ